MQSVVGSPVLERSKLGVAGGHDDDPDADADVDVVRLDDDSQGDEDDGGGEALEIAPRKGKDLEETVAKVDGLESESGTGTGLDAFSDVAKPV